MRTASYTDPDPSSKSAAPALGEPLRISPRGILVVEGFGSSLAVKAGCLAVRSGTGRRVRRAVIERAGRPRLRRLVMVGRSGYVSLGALSWVLEVGASWSWIARDGEILATSVQLGLDEPKLRRAQATAPETDAGLAVVRYLLGEKIAGHAAVLRRRFPDRRDAAEQVSDYTEQVKSAPDIEAAATIERQAAAAYWGAWGGLEPAFARKDLRRVPERWRMFQSRGSLVANGPRTATDPTNALLNLAFGLLECEARVALATIGLDPGLGFGLHADQRSRANGACDLMEAARPAADGLVLDAIARRTFRRSDFPELPNGAVRIRPELAKALVEGWVPALSDAVAPHAEKVASILATSVGARQPSTRLTQRTRARGHVSAERAEVLEENRRRTRARATVQVLPPACWSCGIILREDRGRFCDECRRERRAEHLRDLQKAGPAALAAMRAAGKDPSRTPQARSKLSKSISRRSGAVAAWDREHGERPDPAVFRREIWPGLRQVPLSKIVAATGLSLRYASQIRRGEKVPHPVQWDSLRSLPPRSSRS